MWSLWCWVFLVVNSSTRGFLLFRRGSGRPVRGCDLALHDETGSVYRCPVRPCLDSAPGPVRPTPGPSLGTAPSLPACAPLPPDTSRRAQAFFAARAPPATGTEPGTAPQVFRTLGPVGPTQHRTACRGSCPGPPLPDRTRV